jgi:Bacterial Ig-like domain (group 3)/Chitobiase/beta-hexosaminidase C-terminal domain
MRVRQRDSIATLSTSANPQSHGQWITFTATVAAADASSLPTGKVTFSVDGDAVPAVPLNDGEATWTTYSLSEGSHIIEAAYGGSSTFSSSTSNSVKEAIVPPPTGASVVAAPAFSPAAGKYAGSVMVTLKDTNPNATIYYTVGGSAPSLYTGPITIPAGYTTVEAFASASGSTPSAIVQASYSVISDAPTPVLSPASGSYAPGQEVAISDADPTATIRCTTDGTIPTTKSTLYTRTLVLTGTETIQAIAFATGDAKSEVATATYTPE